MTMQRFFIVLSLVNFGLLILLAGTVIPRSATGNSDMLRGRGLQIVDADGRIRASIAILPAAGSEAETVLLRLINRAGQPSVKISASETGSGLSFVGGDDASYVVLQAEGPDSSLKLVGPGGRRQIIAP